MKCGVCGKYVYQNLARCNNCEYKLGARKTKWPQPKEHPYYSGGSQRRWQVELDIQKRKALGHTDFVYPGRKEREDTRIRVD